jgi:hypothetical protein
MPTYDFVIDFGAPTDGTTSCDTAVSAWQAAAAANDGSTLIIPAYNGIGVSSPYHIASNSALGAGINNCTISAQNGASVDNCALFKFSYSFATTNSARIQSVGLGSYNLTLINSSDASKFSVGGWIIVTGLGTQSGASGPPNFEYVEFHRVVSISGSIIRIADPLTYTYLSTWPLTDPTQAPPADQGGPGTIYTMPSAFSGTQTWSGLKVIGTSGVGINTVTGEQLILDGMDFSSNNGPSPSVGKRMIIKNTNIGAQNEVDKCLEYLEYSNCTGSQIICQSAAPNRLVIKDNCNFTVNGTARVTEIHDTCTINPLIMGSLGFGRAVSLTVDPTCTIGAIDPFTGTRVSAHGLSLSVVTFLQGPGTFSFSKSTSTFDWVRFWVPGFWYVFGLNLTAAQFQITDDAGGQTLFRCLNLTEDANYLYAFTDLVAYPSHTYTGGGIGPLPADTILTYAYQSISAPSPPLPAIAAIPMVVAPPFQTDFRSVHRMGARIMR